MTILIANKEQQVHNDKYHGTKLVTTYSKVKVHTNEAPPIQEVTRNLERELIPNFTYTNNIISLDLSEINLMQCRIIDKDPSNVAQILNFLQKEGYDPTQLPPSVVKFRGKYYLINGHHQYEALTQRGQTIWNFDVYEYNGIDDLHIFQSCVKALGRRINLSGDVPKKDHTPKDLATAYVLEIKENKERTGIAFLEYGDNGVPIPLDEASVKRVLERDGFTSRWSPDDSSGLKSCYTRNLRYILRWEEHTRVSNIRSLDDIRLGKILRGGKFNKKGKITVDGCKGYVTSTDDPASRVARIYEQIINSPGKIRYLSHSGATDDPQEIIDNEIQIRDGLWDMYLKSIESHNKILPAIDENIHTAAEVKKYTPGTAVSREEWETLYEWWSVSQLDDEKGEVLQRGQYVSTKRTFSWKEDSTIPELDRIMNIA